MKRNINKTGRILSLTITVAMCMTMLSAKAQADTWDGTSPTTWTGTGNGTQSSPYLIENAAQLAYLAYMVNHSTDTVNHKVSAYTYHVVGADTYWQLTTDINLNSHPWTPIGYLDGNTNIDYYSFGGHFDGGGHTISGLSIDTPTLQVIGLFGCVYGANISNLTVSGSVTRKSNTIHAYGGGIVGYAYSATIDNCSNGAAIADTSSNAYSGGIVGYANGTTSISHCENTGNISAASGSSGGIVGYATGTTTSISHCKNTGEISATGNSGGIVGIAHGTNNTISHCHNTGAVSTANTNAAYSGGIVGRMDGNNSINSISHCDNTGDIVSTTTSSSNNPYSGGIVGQAVNGTITASNCHNEGDIVSTATTSSSAYSGGMAGYANNASINTCDNTGDISASAASAAYSGGIVGNAIGTSTISYCDNTGDIASTTTSSSLSSGGTGGIVGSASGTTEISRCRNMGAGAVSATSSSHTDAYSGGIAGNAGGETTISYCYNTQNVSSASTYPGMDSGKIFSSGGIVGNAGGTTGTTIENCYNTGGVSTSGYSSGYSFYSGGIAGYASSGTNSISNSYNTGSLTAPTFSVNKGGIVGYKESSGVTVTVSNSYYLSTYGNSTYGGTSKSEADMKDAAFVTLLGAAFAADNLPLNNGYPVLTDIRLRTQAATAVTHSSANLQAVLTSNISLTFESTGFQYKTGSGSYTSVTGTVTVTGNPPEYTLECDLSGLSKETAYQFRAFVKPAGRDTIYGNVLSFTTLEAASVTVTANNGSVSGNEGYYAYNTAAMLTATPNTGYAFVKWTSGTDLSTDNPFTFTVTRDTALTAIFAPISYSITYHTTGGTEIAAGAYTIEEAVTLPEPTRNGYGFDGWYDNSGFTGTAVTGIPTGSTGNKEYWAKWTAITYNITYEDLYGASNSNPASYTIESETITLANPGTRTGYAFAGWSPSNSIPTGSTGDTTFTAQWTPVTYSITYGNLHGADNSNPTSYTIESGTITLANPGTRAGYDFTGWTEGTGIAAGSTGDTTFTAQWTAIPYEISYELNGGTNHADNPATYTIEEAVTLNPPTKAGYDFTNWTEGSGIAAGSTGDTTFTAQWTPVTYSINYGNLHGAGNSNPTSYTIESGTITLADPGTRAGYDFTGWTEGTGIAAGSTGDTTFTAQWTAIPYTISYVLDGGTNHAANPATYTIEEAVTLNHPTKAGYDFTGWSPSSNIPAGSTGDKTFTALWTLVTYSINYGNLHGAGNSNPTSYTIESGTITLANPGTRTGYTFTGWSPGSSIPTGSTGNKTFTAQWTPVTYTLTFNANGGTVSPATQTATHNTAVGELPVPARSGYTFAGWNTAQDGSGTAYIAATAYTQTDNLTLYAQWTPQSAGSAALIFLDVSDGTLTPAFNASVTQYTVEVPGSTSSLTLTAAGVPGSTVTGAGVKNLATGSNTYPITVTAADNSVQVYTVTVTRLPLGTGVADELQVDVTLYPNPFAGSLHLTGAEGCTLRVVSVSGATVHTQKITSPDETVHLEGLPAGMYFFRLEKDGKTKTVKGVKN